MKEYIKKLAKEGLRIDGRKFDEYRNVKVEFGISKKADGSAMAIIGKTKVMAGVKLELGEPYRDSPDEGSLMVSYEESQIANPLWEGGPPNEEAIEVARTVDRGIRESKMIDLKGLCIKKGELVWKVFIDIYPLNYDGNIIDACFLAAVGALLNTRIPKREEDKVLYGELTKKKLPITKIPIPTTFVKIGERIFVDPNKLEEELMDARLSIMTSGKDKINALQKSGIGGFTVDEIKEMIEKSFKIKESIKKILEVKK